jgi:hypothetical protein
MLGKDSFKTLLAASALALMAGGANASSVACSAAVTDFVVPNVGCEVLTSANNDDNDSVKGMFLVDDWMQIAKVNDPGGTDGPLTVTGNQLSGTWSIAGSVFETWTKVMLVFKSSNENAGVLPGSVIGYLIELTPGDYDTPFSFFKDKQEEFEVKNISHVSLYVSNPSPVPLPAAGFLLVGALGGLAALRRRRRAV